MTGAMSESPLSVQESAQDRAKRQAANKVIEEFVRDGMTLGLGSGTTAHFFVRALGDRAAALGWRLRCAATSQATGELARKVGLVVMDPNDIGPMDLTVDGADEISPQLHMIKGGGACLLWEKILAQASRKMIAICDDSKWVDVLGSFPLPVDVVPFAWKQTRQQVARVMESCIGLSVDVVLRQSNDKPVVTDSGHYILDCHCGRIPDPVQLESRLHAVPGVVESGLFTREAHGAVVAGCADSIRVVLRPASV